LGTVYQTVEEYALVSRHTINLVMNAVLFFEIFILYWYGK